jgi:hypothetical protein
MKHCLLVSFILLSLFSCQKKVEPLTADASITNARTTGISIFREEPGNGDCVTPVSTELVNFPDETGALQGKGVVSVSNDKDYLYVVVSTLDPETLIATASLLYGDAATMNNNQYYSEDPMTGFNKPQLREQLQTPEHVYTFKVPLTSINGNCVKINVHAVFYTVDASGAQVKFPVWTAPLESTAIVTEQPWSAYVDYCAQFCVEPTCGQLRTQTPGGWGTNAFGNNPGAYRDANFANAFPSGLTVGCTPDYNILFTSSAAVRDFLPSGGKAQAFTMSYIDPTGLKNVLAGHLVALTLSVGFDDADINFGEAGITLGAMQVKNGVFQGWTVADFLLEANRVIGGCSKAYSIHQVLQTAASINENYVDGTTDNGFLVCPE